MKVHIRSRADKCEAQTDMKDFTRKFSFPEKQLTGLISWSGETKSHLDSEAAMDIALCSGVSGIGTVL